MYTKQEALKTVNEIQWLLKKVTDKMAHLEALPEVDYKMDKSLRKSQQDIYSLMGKLEKIKAKIVG